MGRIVSLSTALVLVSAAPGNAQDDFARKGFYVGLGGTYAIDTFENELEDEIEDALGGPVNVSVDDSLGINGRIGYRFHRHFSAEVQAEWLDGFEADVSVPGFGKIAGVDLEPWVVTGNVKGHLLTGRYQPFLLVGLGVMTAKAKVRDTVGLGLSASERLTDFTTRFGAGVDLYATEKVVFSVGADYVLPIGDLDDADYVSVGWGLQYRF